MTTNGPAIYAGGGGESTTSTNLNALAGEPLQVFGTALASGLIK